MGVIFNKNIMKAELKVKTDCTLFGYLNKKWVCVFLHSIECNSGYPDLISI